MDTPNLRWWGWGTLDRAYSLKDRSRFWPKLRSWLELPGDLQERCPPSLEEVELRPSRLDEPVLSFLCRMIGEEAVRTDRRARVEHACGKAYRDLIRLRAGIVPNPPDAVIYPADEGQVVAVLSWAAERDIAVIPFGGGSTVLGAVEPGVRLTVSMDMARLDRLISLDSTSWTARIQAGATGPEVESQLNERGFTLGHFPRSFEFSTLGGWIATRAAGYASTGYGRIEDLTQAVRLVASVGIVETRSVPIAGPRLLDVLIGSEGAYGVITEATVRICPCPKVQDYRGFLFRTLEDGVDAVRDLVQHGPRPTVVHLSDAREAAFLAALARGRRGMWALVDRMLKVCLERRGYGCAGDGCFLLLGYDGEADVVRGRWRRAMIPCRDHGGFSLGRAAGRSWKGDRFTYPYLRDRLLGAGMMVDTVEAAASWSNLLLLYERVTNVIQAVIRNSGGGPGYVMAHVSYVCEWGASLSFTFLGRQVEGQEVEQWWMVRQAVAEAALAAGGVLRHHRGVGGDRASWLERDVGSVEAKALRELKRALDPTGMMNPGVLLPG